MLSVNRVRSALLGLTLGIVGLAGFASPAAACDTVRCSYDRVVSYETRNEHYVVCVTRYDHCGNAYNVYETRCRTVSVPVAQWVKVCY